MAATFQEYVDSQVKQMEGKEIAQADTEIIGRNPDGTYKVQTTYKTADGETVTTEPVDVAHTSAGGDNMARRQIENAGNHVKVVNSAQQPSNNQGLQQAPPKQEPPVAPKASAPSEPAAAQPAAVEQSQRPIGYNQFVIGALEEMQEKSGYQVEQENLSANLVKVLDNGLRAYEVSGSYTMECGTVVEIEPQIVVMTPEQYEEMIKGQVARVYNDKVAEPMEKQPQTQQEVQAEIDQMKDQPTQEEFEAWKAARQQEAAQNQGAPQNNENVAEQKQEQGQSFEEYKQERGQSVEEHQQEQQAAFEAYKAEIAKESVEGMSGVKAGENLPNMERTQSVEQELESVKQPENINDHTLTREQAFQELDANTLGM